MRTTRIQSRFVGLTRQIPLPRVRRSRNARQLLNQAIVHVRRALPRLLQEYAYPGQRVLIPRDFRSGTNEPFSLNFPSATLAPKYQRQAREGDPEHPLRVQAFVNLKGLKGISEDQGMEQVPEELQGNVDNLAITRKARHALPAGIQEGTLCQISSRLREVLGSDIQIFYQGKKRRTKTGFSIQIEYPDPSLKNENKGAVTELSPLQNSSFPLAQIVGALEELQLRPDDMQWVYQFDASGMDVLGLGLERQAKLTEIEAFVSNETLDLGVMARPYLVNALNEVLARRDRGRKTPAGVLVPPLIVGDVEYLPFDIMQMGRMKNPSFQGIALQKGIWEVLRFKLRGLRRRPDDLHEPLYQGLDPKSSGVLRWWGRSLVLNEDGKFLDHRGLVQDMPFGPAVFVKIAYTLRRDLGLEGQNIVFPYIDIDRRGRVQKIEVRFDRMVDRRRTYKTGAPVAGLNGEEAESLLSHLRSNIPLSRNHQWILLPDVSGIDVGIAGPV